MTFTKTRISLLLWLAVVTALLIAPLRIHAQQEAGGADTSLEQGKFILHKFEQPIGEESYQIGREGDSVTAKIDFTFTAITRSQSSSLSSGTEARRMTPALLKRI